MCMSVYTYEPAAFWVHSTTCFSGPNESIHVCVCIYIYIYIHTHTVYIYRERESEKSAAIDLMNSHLSRSVVSQSIAYGTWSLGLLPATAWTSTISYLFKNLAIFATLGMSFSLSAKNAIPPRSSTAPASPPPRQKSKDRLDEESLGLSPGAVPGP